MQSLLIKQVLLFKFLVELLKMVCSLQVYMNYQKTMIPKSLHILGAGIGINRTKWDNVTVAGTNSGDSWVSNVAGQVKVGAAFETSKTSDFYLEGVYGYQAGYTLDNFEWGNVNSWSVRTGLKFKI